MHKHVRLLLTENVDGLGIVGDVVNVRLGFARNFLMPRDMATTPSDEAIEALAVRRAEAERELSALRSVREKMFEKINGYEVNIERSCNDQGQLYGSVTQRDIADALGEAGFAVKPREVRLPHTIKRVDSYPIHIKLAADLDAEIKVWVVPDRELPTDADRVEMEFDNEGNLIRPGKRGKKPESDGQDFPPVPPEASVFADA